MAEFSLMVTGIGGQGIQLLSKTLALAATLEGRHAMLSAEVGGEMRGGPTLASLVIGDEPVHALPVLEEADVLVMAHHKFSERAASRLLSGGLCVSNSSVVEPAALPPNARVVDVPATLIAREMGAQQAGGFVLLGAVNALTDLVRVESLVAAMEQLLPPYRRQHAAANAEALERGANAVTLIASTVPMTGNVG